MGQHAPEGCTVDGLLKLHCPVDNGFLRFLAAVSASRLSRLSV
jgi:hypothetical protein